MTNDEALTPRILVVSGGIGSSGEQVTKSVLAQFPDHEVETVTVPHVRNVSQVEDAIARAAVGGATIVHTLVDPALRQVLANGAQSRGVPAIDLMGGLMDHLSAALGQEPVAQPGRYRRLRREYFDRIAAIDFAMAHDDGMNPPGWREAEIVLVGVSRVGKTPLTMYLAVQGWKVANIPFVPSVPPGEDLDVVDRRRVIALDIDPTELSRIRDHRRRELGMPPGTDYTEAKAIWEESEEVQKIFRRRGYGRIDVTNKPVETLADEVARLITRRLGESARRG
jgi:regulator of PEP synthase PpsR (kinase-PPPase family)